MQLLSNFKSFCLCVVMSVSASAFAEEYYPLEHISMMPVVSAPDISPDGKHILSMAVIDGVQTAVVSKYGDREITPIIKLSGKRERVEDATWVNNDKIIVTASFPKKYGKSFYRIYRPYIVDKDGKNMKQVKLKNSWRHRSADYISDIGMLAVLPDDPDHILITSLSKRDDTPAVFKYNVNTGKAEKVVSSSDEITSWFSNRDGEVLLGSKNRYDRAEKKTYVEIFYRPDTDTSDWSSLGEFLIGNGSTFSPILMTDDKKSFYVLSNLESDKTVIQNYDIATKKLGEIYFGAGDYDVSGAIIRDGKIVGARFTDDFVRYEYLDREYGSRQRMIERSLGQFNTFIVSSSDDKNRLIVAATSPDLPTKYFLFDLAAKSGGVWFSQYPYLEGMALPPKQKFTYKARDGFTLHGYLTHGSKGKDSPLIVWPHGGPTARDSMYFDSFVSMLSRRGYAVLQMNFRGSEGYGKEYLTSGYRQWGKLMQTDVYDAIEWVKENKMADTNNMCLVGASYGGYVALTAGFQKPDDFKCIVSFAGISDIHELLKTEGESNLFKGIGRFQIADIRNDDDVEDIKRNSAINYVNKYKAPTLLIHGEDDKQVNIRQSRIFYEKMKEEGKDVKYIVLEDGTHYLDYPENRKKAFKAIDEFIGKYLK